MAENQENIPIPGRDYFIRPVQTNETGERLKPGLYKVRRIGIHHSTGLICFFLEDSEIQYLVKDYIFVEKV